MKHETKQNRPSGTEACNLGWRQLTFTEGSFSSPAHNRHHMTMNGVVETPGSGEDPTFLFSERGADHGA